MIATPHRFRTKRQGSGELLRCVGRFLRGELAGWTEDVAEDLPGAGYRVRLC